MKKFLRLPPLFPVVFTVVAAVIHVALWSFEPLISPWTYISGGSITAIAALICVSSAIAFKNHGESLHVGKPTQKIVSDGIYATSRNPVYLGFVLAILGIGCFANSFAIMLASIPAFAWFNWYTIPREEHYLRNRLGREYEEYIKLVRRWL
jgi:protein-S-isoprenylcysteine O-methyltransferase Ste14